MNSSKHRKYGRMSRYKETEKTPSWARGGVRERAEKMELFNKGMWFCS